MKMIYELLYVKYIFNKIFWTQKNC